ncbi:HXXXD-type acyl-transferase family protein [Raphanus sativus]|uniref:Protein ENHANCED PSEUDOMONAS SUSCEPTIBILITY 1-like n=1 Tax=Raphanus sativus TaxID=3726 RepID=A0A6J0L400_RAPSA|nr:protein ENHANCED PSEUDOMONAS SUSCEPTIBILITY 1-like [Raphanus sativus]KAJ4878673.1 HXXXD-type acyl-transferase family protein [Raphanus sativus]
MEDLVVKSTSIVHPINIANQSISDRVKTISLTPWDLIRLRFGYPQRGLFFHKPDDSNIDTIISKLKASLSIALHHFYPLAGRLVKEVNQDDNTVSYFISCCDDDGSGSGGVKFIHAAAKTLTISDLVKSGFVDGLLGYFFFPATGIKNYQGVSNPLLMVQVTELKDGMFISYGYNHTAADGKSIWKFINAWSEICFKGFGSAPMDLFLKGWFLDRIKYPIRVPDPETEQPSHGASTTSNTLQEIVFRLTKENVLKLKAKANDEAVSKEDGEISSFQAVLGHIWRSRVKHGGMSREEETRCRVPIDMRQRLKPKLKEDCFGNLVHTGIVTVKVGEMLDHGLGWLARRINEMVRSQTDENVKTFGENWVKNVEIPVSVSTTLLVTSCPRFDVYGNDFGWDKPIGLRSGPPHSDGKLVVLQGAEEGGLEFQGYFPSQVVVKLLCDAEFLECVDIAS